MFHVWEGFKVITFDNPWQKIIDAAENVKQGIDCYIQIDPELECPPFGETCWIDSGEVAISLAGGVTIEQSLEILAHELAHVIAGESAEHGMEWESAFQAILEQYNKIAFDSQRPRWYTSLVAVTYLLPRQRPATLRNIRGDMERMQAELPLGAEGRRTTRRIAVRVQTPPLPNP